MHINDTQMNFNNFYAHMILKTLNNIGSENFFLLNFLLKMKKTVIHNNNVNLWQKTKLINNLSHIISIW